MSVSLSFHQDHMLRDAISVFLEQDWHVGSQLTRMVQLEKPRCMAHRTAALLMVFMGIFGTVLVILNKVRCAKERVTVLLRSDGTLELLGNRQQIVTADPRELAPVAASVQGAIGWGEIVVLSLLANTGFMILMQAAR